MHRLHTLKGGGELPEGHLLLKGGPPPQEFVDSGELAPAFSNFSENQKSVNLLKSCLKEVDFAGGRQSDLIRLRGLISTSVKEVPFLQRSVEPFCVTASNASQRKCLYGVERSSVSVERDPN